jgi:prolyl-tRNA synthetase (EC 6.1.1.15)
MVKDKCQMENNKTNFSEWYNEIIDIAKLSDKRYNIKE